LNHADRGETVAHMPQLLRVYSIRKANRATKSKSMGVQVRGILPSD
jgi:hypothetical protein